MQITAALVKELRERTGAGMMECKGALVENNGDIEAAIEHMRKTGLAKAAKKAGRVAAEGLILAAVEETAKRALLVEVNCETDFVAKGEDFIGFARAVADLTLSRAPADLEALHALPLGPAGESVEHTRQTLVAKLGENITVRRFAELRAEDHLGVYLHGTRIGVLVALSGGSAELAKDVAMHIAASRPVCVDESQVPADLLAKEREIYQAQAAESGKPAEIIEKMVGGRLKKFVEEVTLVGQPFVKDPDTKVGKLLDQAGAKVSGFVRFEVGEGIEKKSENFAEEVMSQVRGG